MKSAMKTNNCSAGTTNVQTRRNKHVRFSPHIAARVTTNRHQYTPKERANTWYKKQEILDIRKRACIMAVHMEYEKNKNMTSDKTSVKKSKTNNSGFFSNMLRPKVRDSSPVPTTTTNASAFSSPYKPPNNNQRKDIYGNIVNNKELCYRGLEAYTTRGRERVASLRKQACAAVMREQMIQQFTAESLDKTNYVIDFDAIALAYMEVSWPCLVEAHKIGNMDATWVLRNARSSNNTKASVPLTRKQQHHAKHPQNQKRQQQKQQPSQMRPPLSPTRAGDKPKLMQMTPSSSPIPKKRTTDRSLASKSPKNGGVGALPLTSPLVSPKQQTKVMKSTILKETKTTTTTSTRHVGIDNSPNKVSRKATTKITTSHIRDGCNPTDKLLVESPRNRSKSPIRKKRQLAGRAA